MTQYANVCKLIQAYVEEIQSRQELSPSEFGVCFASFLGGMATILHVAESDEMDWDEKRLFFAGMAAEVRGFRDLILRLHRERN